MQVPGGNPRLNQLCARWQQVWLLALDRQRKLNDGLDRLEEVSFFSTRLDVILKLQTHMLSNTRYSLLLYRFPAQRVCQL